MDRFILIAVLAAVTYGTRISGLVLGQRTVPPILERFLVYVPVAVFAALVTPNLGAGSSELQPRLAGVIVAALTVLRVRQLWAGLAAGMAAYWIVRALAGV